MVQILIHYTVFLTNQIGLKVIVCKCEARTNVQRQIQGVSKLTFVDEYCQMKEMSSVEDL